MGKEDDARLPVLRAVKVPTVRATRRGEAGGELSNASLIYGIGAAVLGAVSFVSLMQGRWVSGLLLLLPAGCFVGYALHYLKRGGR